MMREPTHPGVMLLSGFLEPSGCSIEDMAIETTIPLEDLKEICAGRKDVDYWCAAAIGLATETSPKYWRNLQKKYDMWQARELAKIL